MDSRKEELIKNRKILLKTAREDKDWHTTKESQDIDILSLPGEGGKTIAHLVLRCNEKWMYTEAASDDEVLCLVGYRGRSIAEFLVSEYILPDEHKIKNNKKWLSKKVKIQSGESTFAHIIAERYTSWGESNINAQNYGILSLRFWVDLFKGSYSATVAHVLAKNNMIWGLTAAAENKKILNLTDTYGISVANVLAEHNENWLYTALKKFKYIIEIHGFRVARTLVASAPERIDLREYVSFDDVKSDAEYSSNYEYESSFLGLYGFCPCKESKRPIIVSLAFKDPIFALELCRKDNNLFTCWDPLTDTPVAHIIFQQGAFDHEYFFKTLRDFYILIDGKGVPFVEKVMLSIENEKLRLIILNRELLIFKKFMNSNENNPNYHCFVVLNRIFASLDESWIYSEYAQIKKILVQRSFYGPFNHEPIVHILAANSPEWLSKIDFLNNDILLCEDKDGTTLLRKIATSSCGHLYRGSYDTYTLNLKCSEDEFFSDLICRNNFWNFKSIAKYPEILSRRVCSTYSKIKTIGEAVIASQNIYLDYNDFLENTQDFAWFINVLKAMLEDDSLNSITKLSEGMSIAISYFVTNGSPYANDELNSIAKKFISKIDFDVIDVDVANDLLNLKIDGLPLYEIIYDQGRYNLSLMVQAVILEKLIFFDIENKEKFLNSGFMKNKLNHAVNQLDFFCNIMSD